ncbi:hypothetical protein [Desulfosporosinus sp. BICA1-9]|uniref:hypothetical protein n=1 Tax=Desulfosporosinus sp. BICA1-9 TaxID=1531958 RepID=UPI00054C5908|nr:hypothetical protein [Desulfosporosinus sp. BICA1-9]KJS47830.1 MAG: hypothetical protein VR66_17560 [Peptococcaceae bacterium BRH_c23]KJS85877.1 MAG: hypothetical protein JL57_17900 [Desulfosporosinus sp. BICA1-9]KJS90119.1 MAG: hypothetical protein JL57_03465 [Desulfosporosinus sp. BICA1-9]HBW38070.1 hypothetical protein [Desulfosporosinus sp.]
MKAIKIQNKDVLEAVNSGLPYIEIGNRKFLLFEVEQYPDTNVYEVTDTEEEQLLLEALEGDNPILSDLEIDKILGYTREA